MKKVMLSAAVCAMAFTANADVAEEVEVIETALCVRLKLKTEIPLDTLRNAALNNGIVLGKCREKNNLKYIYLSFAGIPFDMIEEAAYTLFKTWKEI